jgi:hypothetical protein
MPRWLKFVLLMLALLFLASLPLARQFETGSMEGVITNAQGPVAQAAVEARNVMSGAVFQVESDAEGRYKLEYLRPGRYSLWVRAPGHDSLWIPQIFVERGEVARKDVRLEKTRSGPTGL